MKRVAARVVTVGAVVVVAIVVTLIQMDRRLTEMLEQAFEERD